MLGFSVDVYDNNIIKKLNEIRNRISYPLPLYREIGLIYFENTKLRFSSHTDPQGRIWKHNTNVTKALKRLGFKGRSAAIQGEYSTGVWTGALSNAIWIDVRGNSISVGVLKNSPASLYAQVFQQGAKKHSLGGKEPWNDIPPRPFLGFNKKTNDKAMQAIKKYFQDAIENVK